MSRTVMVSVLTLAAMALSLACSAQPPTIVAEKLYDQIDQSWANHDVKQLLAFYDPSFTSVDVKGKRSSFADLRKQQTALFGNPQFRNFNRKTTLKDVQLQAGRMVVYYGNETHYQYHDQKAGWESLINTTSAEATWQKTGDQWKLVMIHALRENTSLDPQWAAARRQDLQNRLEAVQRASSVLTPCNMSYNGCR